jgi:hypothetical protein
MNGIRKEELVKILCKLSAALCSYTKQPCDCKFATDSDTNIGRGSERGSGCPETAVAAQLIAHMTTQEFYAIAERAKINIADEPEPPVIDVWELKSKLQEKKWEESVTRAKNMLVKKPRKSANRRSAYMPGKLPKEVL